MLQNSLLISLLAGNLLRRLFAADCMLSHAVGLGRCAPCFAHVLLREAKPNQLPRPAGQRRKASAHILTKPSATSLRYGLLHGQAGFA
jgi:hypothetical protein